MASPVVSADRNQTVSEAERILERIVSCDGESVESLEERTALLRDLNQALSDMPPPPASTQVTTGSCQLSDLEAIAGYVKAKEGWLDNFTDVRKAWIDRPEDAPVLKRSTYDHRTSMGSREPSGIAVKEIDPKDLPALTKLLGLPEEARAKLGIPEVLSTHTVLGRAEQFDETYFETAAESQKFEIIDVKKADLIRYLKR